MLLLILLRSQFFDRVLGREHEHSAREWENKWEAENYLGKRDGSFMKRTMFMTMLVIFMCCILFDTDTPALAAAYTAALGVDIQPLILPITPA